MSDLRPPRYQFERREWRGDRLVCVWRDNEMEKEVEGPEPGSKESFQISWDLDISTWNDD